ncbi:Hypothetical protein AJF4211_000470 [Avibacterium paragallinarum JF4211]|nr:Hypothetical protein AJF4211_000470 [Avibacterium paragallinarum JF4211]
MLWRKFAFFFGINNEFRSLSDFLSFAYPKERKQRKGNPDQTAFPHFNKIFLTKNQPDVRFALARRDFSKNFISIRAVWTGNTVRVNFKVQWEFWDF